MSEDTIKVKLTSEGKRRQERQTAGFVCGNCHFHGPSMLLRTEEQPEIPKILAPGQEKPAERIMRIMPCGMPNSRFYQVIMGQYGTCNECQRIVGPAEEVKDD